MNFDTFGVGHFLGQILEFGFFIFLIITIFNGFGYIKDRFC
jgi:hypothetical protein